MEAGKKERPDIYPINDSRRAPLDPRETSAPGVTQQRLDSLEFVLESLLKNLDPAEAPQMVERLIARLRDSGIKVPSAIGTPYINTISAEDESPYPGDREIERRIKSYVRWNAMAMVVKANRIHHGIGGHISTFASSATLYEVGFNHFFRGGDNGDLGDLVYFQGHA